MCLTYFYIRMGHCEYSKNLICKSLTNCRHMLKVKDNAFEQVDSCQEPFGLRAGN